MKDNQEYLNELCNESDIPEVVNKKCCEAYEMIYKDCEQKSKNKKRISFKKGMALAACVAVVSVGVVTLPVMAEYIPGLQSAYEFFNKKVYSKDPADKNDLTKYAAPVNVSKSDKFADIVMQSTYCDGKNLSLSFVLTPKSDALKNMTAINSKISVNIDGEDIIDEYELDKMFFTASDDGNFYAIMHFDNLNITEDSELKVDISSLCGVNALVMNYVANDEESGMYLPETTEILYGENYEFDVVVKPDTSNNKTYEVNETQGNVTLESITVTPFMAGLSISGLEEKQSMRVFDQDRNELEFLANGLSFASPLTTARTLTVEIFRLDEDDFPTEYSFDVDIEKGFSEEYNVEFQYDDSKVTYNPPMEEIDKIHYEKLQKEYDKVLEEVEPLPVGTKIKGSPLINITVTGSEIGELSDYGIELDNERLDWYESVGIDIEKSKLLLIDYEVENTQDTEISESFSGLTGISKDFSTENSFYIDVDPNYVSNKDNGGKSSYLYDFEANETKYITLGYIIPDNVIEKGIYLWAVDNEVNRTVTPEMLLSGKASLYEIK